MRISELAQQSREDRRSREQRKRYGKRPTLARFTFGELDDILHRYAQWQEREAALDRVKTGESVLVDIGIELSEDELQPPSLTELDPNDLSQVDHRSHMVFLEELEPVSQEIIDYLEQCPEEEWEEYREYCDDQDIVALAREDPNAFMEYCFRDKDGKSWSQQDFHHEWQGLIPTPEEAKRLSTGEEILAYSSAGVPILSPETGEHMRKSNTTLIIAAREHAKSTQIGIGRTIWELGKNVNLRCTICTASPKLAKDVLFDIAQNIERNPRVRKVFPHLQPDYDSGWNKMVLFVKRDFSAGKDPSVVASSVLSTGAGSRADWLLGDDIIDFRNAVANPALRPMVKRAFSEVWMGLMPPDGRCIYTATPWHEDDATHQYKKEPGWAVWWKPAIWEENDDITGEKVTRVLWPTKWSLAALSTRRSQIGDREFARQFLLQTLSDDEATFPQSAIDRCLDPTRTVFGDNVPNEWARVAGLDLAASLRQRGAWTVLFTFAIDPDNGTLVPVHMMRHKMQFPDLINTIIELFPVLRWELLMVENNGYQQSVVSTLQQRQIFGLNVEGFRTGTNKADAEVGLPALASIFSAGGFSIPAGGPEHPVECLCDLCVWKGELRGHPTAKFSDTVMATWFAQRAAVKIGANFVSNFSVQIEQSGGQQVATLTPDIVREMTPRSRLMLDSNYTALDVERVMWSMGEERRFYRDDD